MDKIRCKWLFQAQGLPTAPFLVARPDDCDYAAMLDQLGGKVMVTVDQAHSSASAALGISGGRAQTMA
ncbi:hypothetical protein ALON55S_07516 [Alishewanella longhuensis]